MLAHLLGRLEGDYSLWPLPVSDGLTASDAAAAAAAETIGLVVVDLGIEVTPAATLDRLEVEAGATRVRVPDPLRLVVAAFESIVHQERARIERGMHPRRFVLVNSANAYFDSFVRSNLNCSHTSAHSRVRRATVRAVATSPVSALRDTTWADALTAPDEPCVLPAGRRLEIAELGSFLGFRRGWAFPDPDAIWTRGPQAELVLASDGPPQHRHLELTFARVGVQRGQRSTSVS